MVLRIAWFTSKVRVLLLDSVDNHPSPSDTIKLLSRKDPLSILHSLSLHQWTMVACQTLGQTDKWPDDNASEMFTYAIFKGSLIKHLSNSDNHQSQTVTMLICEVTIWIVSVLLVNNTFISSNFKHVPLKL